MRRSAAAAALAAAAATAHAAGYEPRGAHETTVLEVGCRRFFEAAPAATKRAVLGIMPLAGANFRELTGDAECAAAAAPHCDALSAGHVAELLQEAWPDDDAGPAPDVRERFVRLRDAGCLRNIVHLGAIDEQAAIALYDVLDPGELAHWANLRPDALRKLLGARDTERLPALSPESAANYTRLVEARDLVERHWRTVLDGHVVLSALEHVSAATRGASAAEQTAPRAVARALFAAAGGLLGAARQGSAACAAGHLLLELRVRVLRDAAAASAAVSPAVRAAFLETLNERQRAHASALDAAVRESERQAISADERADRETANSTLSPALRRLEDASYEEFADSLAQVVSVSARPRWLEDFVVHTGRLPAAPPAEGALHASVLHGLVRASAGELAAFADKMRQATASAGMHTRLAAPQVAPPHRALLFCAHMAAARAANTHPAAAGALSALSAALDAAPDVRQTLIRHAAGSDALAPAAAALVRSPGDLRLLLNMRQWRAREAASRGGHFPASLDFVGLQEQPRGTPNADAATFEQRLVERTLEHLEKRLDALGDQRVMITFEETIDHGGPRRTWISDMLDVAASPARGVLAPLSDDNRITQHPDILQAPENGLFLGAMLGKAVHENMHAPFTLSEKWWDFVVAGATPQAAAAYYSTAYAHRERELLVRMLGTASPEDYAALAESTLQFPRADALRLASLRGRPATDDDGSPVTDYAANAWTAREDDRPTAAGGSWPPHAHIRAIHAAFCRAAQDAFPAFAAEFARGFGACVSLPLLRLVPGAGRLLAEMLGRRARSPAALAAHFRLHAHSAPGAAERHVPALVRGHSVTALQAFQSFVLALPDDLLALFMRLVTGTADLDLDAADQSPSVLFFDVDAPPATKISFHFLRSFAPEYVAAVRAGTAKPAITPQPSDRPRPAPIAGIGALDAQEETPDTHLAAMGITNVVTEEVFVHVLTRAAAAQAEMLRLPPGTCTDPFAEENDTARYDAIHTAHMQSCENRVEVPACDSAAGIVLSLVLALTVPTWSFSDNIAGDPEAAIVHSLDD